MTIIQPLRLPGHVSMELGDFPAHIGIIQRLSIHPKAVCPSPFKFNVLRGSAESLPNPPILSISTSLGPPLFQPLLHWIRLLDYSLQSLHHCPHARTHARSRQIWGLTLSPCWSLRLKALKAFR